MNGNNLTDSKFMLYITDDDSQDREFLTDALSRRKRQVAFREFENGQELIENLITSSHRLPDLILLDLNMPVKNGYDTLEEIRQLDESKNIPVIIFTASSRVEDKERCYKLGCNNFIVKPFSFTEYEKVADDIILFLDNMQRRKAS
jgi:CheY-like chemotaxis protein